MNSKQSSGISTLTRSPPLQHDAPEAPSPSRKSKTIFLFLSRKASMLRSTLNMKENEDVDAEGWIILGRNQGDFHKIKELYLNEVNMFIVVYTLIASFTCPYGFGLLDLRVEQHELNRYNFVYVLVCLTFLVASYSVAHNLIIYVQLNRRLTPISIKHFLLDINGYPSNELLSEVTMSGSLFTAIYYSLISHPLPISLAFLFFSLIGLQVVKHLLKGLSMQLYKSSEFKNRSEKNEELLSKLQSAFPSSSKEYADFENYFDKILLNFQSVETFNVYMMNTEINDIVSILNCPVYIAICLKALANR